MRFPHFQCILQLHSPEPRMADTLCAPCSRSGPGCAGVPIQSSFQGRHHSLRPGHWVEFGAQAIKWIYCLLDDDSGEYKALFADTDYKCLMQELTHGQGMWKRQPSIGDFITFQMHSLMLVAKVWYNFLCVKIKPTLHLSTVTKDKTILLYAMT